ncbi:MAG: L,D-transpeptidase [Gammaproteobacteria bacterium]|nr:L,D-transpeptidase [Gammaproteobacteria bacterium]MCW5584167.1 L,D-transpeptidase [Gammaproteobacteria bacterium]
MQKSRMLFTLLGFLIFILPVCSYSRPQHHVSMPGHIKPPGEKVIIVDPRIHAFGAYSADGKLLLSGLATAGSSWCADIKRSCRTKSGSFRIFSLGSAGCKSSKYPLPRGGAPMPYCMFFNGHQGLHGSYQVVYGNVSHGCVRVTVNNAKWLRYNFVEGPNASNNYRGTKVIVKPY